MLLMLKKAVSSREGGCQPNAGMQSWAVYPEEQNCDDYYSAAQHVKGKDVQFFLISSAWTK